MIDQVSDNMSNIVKYDKTSVMFKTHNYSFFNSIE